MEDITMANLDITVYSKSIDADRFVSLWNVAAATMGGDTMGTRRLAGNRLCALARIQCGRRLQSTSSCQARMV